MKKILYYSLILFLSACATLEYDHTKFFIHPDVKLLSIQTNSMIRERDGQMIVQVIGVSRKNQSVYYKVEWFDKNNMKISTTLTQWKKVNLRENSEFTWNAVSPSRRAISYRVQIAEDIGNGIID